MFKSLARSAVFGIVAAAAGAAGVGIGAFALYAALKGPLGQAGAAGVVAILFLLVALVAVMMLRGGGHKHETHAQGGSSGLSLGGGGGDIKERAIAFAKQRPLVAGGVGLLGALYVLRNPALVTGILGLLAGRQEGKQEARRGWF
jgi:hypothetical protein